MKKLLFILLAFAAILPASADRYLTFGENDTLRISPLLVNVTQIVMVRAHTDGRFDKWDMSLDLPDGITLYDAIIREDMLYIPYLNYLDEPDTCSAQLALIYNNYNQLDSMSASIIVQGYEPDSHGGYNCYGTVKWEAGDYNRMCELYLNLNNFPDTASIYINETLSSTPDQRGFTIPYTQIRKRIFVYVGYMRGDVDGNEILNIADSTMLLDYLLHVETLDQYQYAAADMDGDGIVDMGDLTLLIDYLIINGVNVLDDPTI